MTAVTAPSYPPRVDDDLDFDPTTRKLTLGKLDATLSQGAGNVEVLDAYVDLVAQRRGRRPVAKVEVRTTDIDVLAGLLDLDAPDIDRLIEQILGTSHEEATGLLARLKTRRTALVLAAAAGVVVAGSLASGLGGSSDGPATTQTTRSAGVRPTATAPGIPPGGAIGPNAGPVEPGAQDPAPAGTAPSGVERPPVTETPGGVGLIPPAQVDGPTPTVTETPGGVGLVPPAQVDGPTPTVTETPGGVGLIPPAQVDGPTPTVTETPGGVGLIPPAQVDAPG